MNNSSKHCKIITKNKIILKIFLIVFFLPFIVCFKAQAQAVSVGDFGARPNDGIDDTQNIQKTIDYVYAKGGGTVFFPAGTYNVGIRDFRGMKAALIVYKNIKLQGAGYMITNIRLNDNQGFYTSIILPDFMLGETNTLQCMI